MAGRTPPEAVQNFVDPLQEALGCITRAPVRAGGYGPPDVLHDIILGTGDPVPLRGGSGLSLTVRMRYRIVRAEGERGPWKVSTAAYEYTFTGVDGREVLAYHWQPGGASHVDSPHLHLGAGSGIADPRLASAHLPSGRVSLESIVRLAIEAFGVTSLRGREWPTILERGERAFNAWKTW